MGGTARLQVIVLLAAVLGLDTADKGAMSAVAGSLKDAFDIGNFDFGMLISAVSFVGVIGTLPAGVFVDRTHRQRLLAIAVGCWAVAMAVSGMSTSYTYLLFVRLFLGVVTAIALPAVASLTGDFFPAAGRARVYGFILAGEIVGAGFGFILAGLVSSWLIWRWAFWTLSIPSAALAVAIWRYLPEPARGGQSHLQPGQEKIPSKEDARDDEQGASPSESRPDDQPSGQSRMAQEKMKAYRVRPDETLILDEDPKDKSFWWAARYVLRIRTNLLLIVASALGYYFFFGLRGFGMIYATGHYGLARSTVSALVVVLGFGGIAGVMLGGRLADRMLEGGNIRARILVPAAGLLICVGFIAPALWTSAIYVAMPLLTLGAFSLAAANAPVDAARLDIMHPRLWGRAESVRAALRMALEGGSPMLFGFTSQYIFGGGKNALQWTFLAMLIPLLAASLLVFHARRSYPRDVATVGASLEKQQE